MLYYGHNIICNSSNLPVSGRLVRFLSLSWLVEQVNEDDDIELVIEADDDEGDDAVEKVDARCKSIGDGFSSVSSMADEARRWLKSSLGSAWS